MAFLNLIELLLFTANIVVNVKDGAARCRSLFAHLKARLPFGTPFIRGVEMKMWRKKSDKDCSVHRDGSSHIVSERSKV